MQPRNSLAVEWRPIGGVIPYDRNPRVIPKSAVAKVAASIKEFGWRQPIVVDEAGIILVGHTRLLAAESLGLDEVPVHVATGLSAAQAQAYRLADNRTGEETTWDLPALDLELKSLESLNFDLDLTGFELAEIAELRKPIGGRTEPDDVPVSAPERVKSGELWILGDHRVLCGDATSAGDIDRLLEGARPRLCVSDPPYGVNYDASWRQRATKRSARATGKVDNDDRADWREAWALFPGDVAYIWHAALHASEVEQSLAATGFTIRSQLIWVKSQPILSRGHYHWQHEPCWYAVRSKGHWTGKRDQSTVWPITHQKSETGHSTQKPVDAMRRPMLNNSMPGEAIYDPFLGSGTSVIAAHMEGRRCYGLEINPRYCDVIVARWEAFSGLKAVKA